MGPVPFGYMEHSVYSVGGVDAATTSVLIGAVLFRWAAFVMTYTFS